MGMHVCDASEIEHLKKHFSPTPEFRASTVVGTCASFLPLVNKQSFHNCVSNRTNSRDVSAVITPSIIPDPINYSPARFLGCLFTIRTLVQTSRET